MKSLTLEHLNVTARKQKNDLFVEERIFDIKNLFPHNIDAFLEIFEDFLNLDFLSGAKMPFKLNNNKKRLSPKIKIADINDAKSIADIYKNAYKNTYPNREMEDAKYVSKMILSDDHHVIVFRDDQDNNIGCFRCALDLSARKGYMGGFMFMEQFHGKVDVIISIIGAYIWMWSQFKSEIEVWYCENRTAHNTSQYITSICGIKSVAIFPNKDLFFHNIESDILGVIYAKNVIKERRRKSVPKIIPEVYDCFHQSSERFNLGNARLVNQKSIVNNRLHSHFLKSIVKTSKIDRWGYKKIEFKIENNDSYFSFIYTPWLDNIEKIEYRIDCSEELVVFIDQLKRFVKDNSVRYVEVYVSAYQPVYQRLFLEGGLKPRGYIPCWRYNKEMDVFEDEIVFNSYKGEVNGIIMLFQDYEFFESNLK